MGGHSTNPLRSALFCDDGAEGAGLPPSSHLSDDAAFLGHTDTCFGVCSWPAVHRQLCGSAALKQNHLVLFKSVQTRKEPGIKGGPGTEDTAQVSTRGGDLPSSATNSCLSPDSQPLPALSHTVLIRTEER